MITQSQVELAIEHLLKSAEPFQEAYLALPFEGAEWQEARDAYVNLSNAASELMHPSKRRSPI